MLKTVNRFLISRQFAVWSLLVLAAALIIGGTLPDFALLSEKEITQLQQSRPALYWISSRFQTAQLTQSPLFLILPGAILLSIAMCTVNRLRRRTQPLFGKAEASGSNVEETSTASIGESLEPVAERVQEVLRRRRWDFQETGKNGAIRYLARKGTRGFWGSVVFHMSMLVFLLGTIISFLGRFDAEMVLAEGQSLSLVEDQLLRVNRKGSLSPALSGKLVTLKKFEATFKEDKYPVDYAAHLGVSDNFGADIEKTVRVNQPVRLDKWQIFLHRYGFAPRFELRDAQGRLFFDYFVNLIIPRPEQTDYFDIPSHGLRVETRFFPDYHESEQGASTRSGIPKNPMMRVRVLRDEEPLGEKDVRLGETAGLGDIQLTFAELRYWAWFGIVYDPGYALIVLGFILCIAGLAIRFTISEKWLQVNVERQDDKSLVSLTGRSRYFPALFEKEIGSIRRELEPEPEKAGVNNRERGSE